MSITVSNCNEICNAPTNHSASKMLYSFPKQSRFLKRKTIQYSGSYLDAINFMNSKTPYPIEAQLLAMVENMTSLENYQELLLPTLTTSLTTTVPVLKKGLLSERVDKT